MPRSPNPSEQFRAYRLPLGGVAALATLLAWGCEDPSWWQTEKAIVPVCERVVACGGWGWADSGECEDGLVGNEALGTACDDEQAYLDCVHDCCWDACRAHLSREECRACQPPDCNQCDYLECEALATCEGECRAEACQ